MIETSNPKVLAALETKIAKLEEDKLLLTDKLSQNTKPKSTLGEVIELLRDFLSSPWNIYENGSLLVKKTILKTAFAAPLAYDRQNGYRTSQTSVIFDFLADFTSKCEMVRSRRLDFRLLPPYNFLFNEFKYLLDMKNHKTEICAKRVQDLCKESCPWRGTPKGVTRSCVTRSMGLLINPRLRLRFGLECLFTVRVDVLFYRLNKNNLNLRWYHCHRDSRHDMLLALISK